MYFYIYIFIKNVLERILASNLDSIYMFVLMHRFLIKWNVYQSYK